jgi:hypothetical protein
MSKQRAKATSFESAVVAALHRGGFPEARRNPLAGNKDVGDIGGLPIAIECKNVVKMQLGLWVPEAQREAHNAGLDVGVVWHKRRGVGLGRVEDSYVTMSGRELLWLLRPHA